MEKQINRYASLRVAQVTGRSSPAMAAEMDNLKAEMPEWAIEDAECRVGAVMPSIRQGEHHVA